MLAPLNLLVFFALVLPWFVALIWEHPDFLHYGLVEETMRRYLTTTLHRSGPCYYYGPILLLVFFPWSVLLPEAAVAAWRSRARWTPPTASSSCGRWSWWCSSRSRSPSARATSSRASWRSRP